MKKILLLALPIMVMCAVSCEKPEENNNEPNGPEEIAQGTIEAFATYNGQAAGFLYYSILDISQLDAIQTLSQQFHQACMNEDFDRVEDLEDSYYDIIGEGLCHQESSIGQDFYYDVDPGRYIVMASCCIAYYLNKELGDYFYAYRYLYKIVQVESNQITSVDFNFEDYIVY